MTENSLILQIEEAFSKALTNAHSAFSNIKVVQDNNVLTTFSDGEFNDVVKRFEESQEEITYDILIDLLDLDQQGMYLRHACDNRIILHNDEIKLNVSLRFVPNDGIYLLTEPYIDIERFESSTTNAIIYLDESIWDISEFGDDELIDFLPVQDNDLKDITFDGLKLVDLSK